jgi:hypothetical protein
VIDSSSLFLHVLAAIGLVSGGVVQVLAGVRVRAAITGDEIASWAAFARQAGLLIVGSAVLLLMTGGHLAGAIWTNEARSGFSYPFITLGAAGLLLLASVGPMLGGAKLRRLVARAEESDGDGASVELLSQARAPSLWGPLHSLVGVGIGLVALMTYKPGWAVGALLLVATFALGWAGGSMLSRSPSR